MLPITLSDETRCLKAPSNWDTEKHGRCSSLSICDRTIDGRAVMMSAWLPDADDRDLIAKGCPLFLSINGTSHPVVSMNMGVVPVGEEVSPIAADIATVIETAVAARIQVAQATQPLMRLLVSPPIVSADAVSIRFHSVAALEIIPKDYSGWSVFGPFGLSRASSADVDNV